MLSTIINIYIYSYINRKNTRCTYIYFCVIFPHSEIRVDSLLYFCTKTVAQYLAVFERNQVMLKKHEKGKKNTLASFMSCSSFESD